VKSILVNISVGMRMLLRDKGMTCICLLALILGIGASTAMFSVLYAVILDPFPFHDQDRLVVAWKVDRQAGNGLVELSYPEYRDWRDRSKSFTELAAMPTTVYGYSYVMNRGGESKQIESARVSANFFSVLGVHPVLGREFEPDEDHVGANPVVVLSHQFWEREFNASPDVVGTGLPLSGVNFTIVGVLPGGFSFPQGVDAFTTLGTNPRWVENRDAQFLQVLGRLKPGVSAVQANVELDSIEAQVATEHPETQSGGDVPVVESLPNFITGSSKTLIYIVFSGSLILLLIAAINLASLLGTKAIAREGEIAIRVALGASRRQLFNQFLAEGLLLAMPGAIIGVLFSGLLLHAIRLIAPQEIPRILSASLSVSALSFTLACLIFVTVLFGCAPLLLIRETHLQVSLRNFSGNIVAGLRSRKWGPVFLILEISTSLALLVLAGTVVQSVHNLQNVRLGYDPDKVFTCAIFLSPTTYPNPAARRTFFRTLIENLQARPEVISAGAVLVRPLEGPIGWDAHYALPGQDQITAKKNPMVNFEVVTPAYFRSIGTPLLTGRSFQEEDDESAPNVAVVSETVADAMYGSAPQAVGHVFTFADEPKQWKIIGVVGDARYRRLSQISGDIFLSYRQSAAPVRYLTIQTRNNPSAIAPVVRHAIAQIDASQAESREATMRELVDIALSQDRFYSKLLLFFAGSALMLAAIGVYGLVSDMTAKRAREFAIRMVLGAQAKTIATMVLRSTLAWVAIAEFLGTCVGILTALAIRTKLFEVSPANSISILVSTVLLVVVCLIACVPSVLRVGTLDPNRVLRE
jgi:putative ABC transport system permease protein